MDKENQEKKNNLEDQSIPEVESSENQVDLKNEGVVQSLDSFNDSLEENEANVSNSVNENVDFSEISGEIASKVLENVDEPVDENTRMGNVLGEFESVNNGEKIDEFLNDIGITRKQFFIFLGIVLCFIAGVVISFYYLLSLFASQPEDIDVNNQPPENIVEEEVDEGPGLWEKITGWFSGGDKDMDEPEVPVKDEEPIEVDEPTGVSTSGEVGNDKPQVLESEAVELGYIVGVGEQSTNSLSEYVRTYRELRAVFNTDLFAYLSVVEDRESAYDDYLLRFKGTYQKALNSIQDLEAEILEYQNRVARVEAELEEVENMFFGEVEALNSEAVPELLKTFQEVARQEVVITSELKARQAILDRYNNVENVVADRITAIELNREAFIKGVQVVDYRNIDLDLVIEGQ